MENESLKLSFGKILRELRVAIDVSQENLALECGLDRTYISMLERGIRQPSLTTVFVIADYFKISPSKIIAKTEKELSLRESNTGE